MEAPHYWLYLGLCLGAGFIIGTVFGGWVQVNAYRQIGKAVRDVCDTLEDDEAEDWE